MAATEAGSRAARALDDLYRRHGGEVYRYAYAMLGNRADAEDVTQTTFVNALRALEQGQSPRKASSWLLAISHNIVRQRFRQARSRPSEVELHDEMHGATAADDETPTLASVVDALGRIPPSQREAIVLREFEGRPYAEIAEMLGISTSALETLLFRARRSLAEELENLVTCEQAEQSVSRALDGRLSRKERKRLTAHMRDCPACTRFELVQKRGRRALRGLALLPDSGVAHLAEGNEHGRCGHIADDRRGRCRRHDGRWRRCGCRGRRRCERVCTQGGGCGHSRRSGRRGRHTRGLRKSAGTAAGHRGRASSGR